MTDVVYGSSNGAIFLATDGPYYDSSDYNQPLRSYAPYAPYAWGGPVLAYWFADNMMQTADPKVPEHTNSSRFQIRGGDAPGFYYRTITENAETKFEVIAWNNHSISELMTYNVVRLVFSQDGSVRVTYDQAIPTGFEDIAQYSPRGVRSNAQDPWLVEGKTITFPPVPAD